LNTRKGNWFMRILNKTHKTKRNFQTSSFSLRKECKDILEALEFYTTTVWEQISSLNSVVALHLICAQCNMRQLTWISESTNTSKKKLKLQLQICKRNKSWQNYIKKTRHSRLRITITFPQSQRKRVQQMVCS